MALLAKLTVPVPVPELSARRLMAPPPEDVRLALTAMLRLALSVSELPLDHARRFDWRGTWMKKRYEKPTLDKRERLSSITAFCTPSTCVN